MSEKMRIPQDSTGAGTIDLVILKNVDPAKFRATAKFLDTGSTQTVSFAPSGGHGEIPAEGSLCLIYRKGPFFAQLIKEISDFVPETTLSLDQRLENGEFMAGTVPMLETGEVYVGRNGRAWFNSSGDVDIMTQSSNLRLNFDNTLARATLNGNNLTFSTTGDGIRVMTRSSIPSSFGDILRLEKNVPAPTIPERISGVAPLLVNLAYVEINEFGAVNAGTAAGAFLSLSELGVAHIGNRVGRLNIGVDGEIDLSGDKNVGIEGLLNVRVNGNGPGFNVLLDANANEADRFGVARVNDTAITSAAEDAPYWQYVTQLQAFVFALSAALASSPTTPGDGGASYKAGIVAALALAPVPPTAPGSITSRINTGSASVTAGD